MFTKVSWRRFCIPKEKWPLSIRRLSAIGHFRVPKTLTFKMRPRAQPFFWKRVVFLLLLLEWKTFPYQRRTTQPRFETQKWPSYCLYELVTSHRELKSIDWSDGTEKRVLQHYVNSLSLQIYREAYSVKIYWKWSQKEPIQVQKGKGKFVLVCSLQNPLLIWTLYVARPVYTTRISGAICRPKLKANLLTIRVIGRSFYLKQTQR